MDETQTRLMLEALRKMADAPDGRARTYGPDRPHLKGTGGRPCDGLAPCRCGGVGSHVGLMPSMPLAGWRCNAS